VLTAEVAANRGSQNVADVRARPAGGRAGPTCAPNLFSLEEPKPWRMVQRICRLAEGWTGWLLDRSTEQLYPMLATQTAFSVGCFLRVYRCGLAYRVRGQKTFGSNGDACAWIVNLYIFLTKSPILLAVRGGTTPFFWSSVYEVRPWRMGMGSVSSTSRRPCCLADRAVLSGSITSMAFVTKREQLEAKW
jgi:hypothetical protein